MKNAKAGLGRLHSQVEGAYHLVCKGVGISRHRLKLADIRSRQLHSDNARYAYLRVWHMIVDYCHKKFSIQNIYDLNSEMVASWLQFEIERSLAPATISQYVAAIGMFQCALEDFCKANGHERIFDFSFRKEIAARAIRDRVDGNRPWQGRGRAYPRPEELINAIPSRMLQLCARLQYEGCLRAEGVGHAKDRRSRISLSLDNLKGTMRDPFFNDRSVGIVDQREKGGRTTRHYISVSFYKDLEEYLLQHGPIRADYRQYLKAIEAAAKNTDQFIEGRGSHGLKHCSVMRFVEDGIRAGKSPERIYSEASQRSSHNRMDVVTKFYMGR